MVSLRKNSLHEVTIEDYSAEGMGVARIDGMVVFVKNAVRGERCVVKLTKVLKNMCYAIIDSISDPSPRRIEPDCGIFRLCGGCDFRHIAYEEECLHKQRRVDDTLRRVGGLEIKTERFNPSGATERYRNKAQYFFSGEKAGFYRAGSHDVIDCPDCLIQDRRAGQCREGVLNWMKKYSVPAFDERTGKGTVRYLQVRTGTGGALVTVVSGKRELPEEGELVRELRRACPEVCSVVLNINPAPGNVILGGENRVLFGEGYVTDVMCGKGFRISPHSFYQINRPQAEMLYRRAAEYLDLTGGESLVDLYCGIGTIGLSMAEQVGKLLGVEIVPQAVEDARDNARRNGVGNAEFICADAGEAAAMLARRGEKPDAIIVDPPRKGLSRDVIEAVIAMSPEKLVYISCDPATLARDLKLLCAGGYKAVRCEAFDLFPRCAHVETVVLLSKGEIDSKKVRVEFSLEDMDMSEFQDGATYPQIKEYVLEHTGLKVSNLYISQIKRKCGLEVGKNYNLPKSEDSRQPQCPPEKEKAIREAFKYFGMI